MIELLETPVVERWISAYNVFKSHGIPPVAGVNSINYHPSEEEAAGLSGKRDSYAQKINESIAELNKIIDGKKFPYKAYLGMPWAQTNRIHRCFTTGSITEHCWHHELTQDQLAESKLIGSPILRKWTTDNTDAQFRVIDINVFQEQLHNINHYVHEYENSSHSPTIDSICNEHKERTGKYPLVANINWSRPRLFNDEGTCIKSIFMDSLKEVSYEELISSFPDNYEECNVSILKSIGGKDYETCFANLDDPSEFDIRNIEHINGGLTIHPNNEHYECFNKNQFYNWVKSYGIRDELFSKVPIGKVIDSTVDLTKRARYGEGELSIELLN